MIACNSAAAAGFQTAREIAAERGVEVIAVIEPEAEIAAAITASGRVGVLATPATVERGAYRRRSSAQRRDLEITQVASADLATDHPERLSLRRGGDGDGARGMRPASGGDVDTVILGCTHYPLVAPMLQRILGRDVRLVTAGHALAASAQRVLEAAGADAHDYAEGTYSFLCTGDVDSFRELGTRFLQMPLGDVEHVEL